MPCFWLLYLMPSPPTCILCISLVLYYLLLFKICYDLLCRAIIGAGGSLDVVKREPKQQPINKTMQLIVKDTQGLALT